MLDKITILCFAASYTVALGLEATRFWFRSGVRGVLLVGFSAAGLLAHSMYLAALWTQSGVTPLFSEYDWYLTAAWILAVIYFYFLCVRPKNSLGLFFLPLVLALIGVANFLASKEPFAKPEGTRILHIAHGMFLLLGTVTVLFGFAAGVMYLVQASRLKHKRPPRQGLQLPSLEWLAKTNTRALHISLVLVLGGFVTGLVLSNLRHNEVHWSDPIVLVSTGMVGWMLASSLFSLIYKPARVGQKVAYLTMASFVFLVLTLAAFLYDTRHGGVEPAARSQIGIFDNLELGGTGKRSLPVSSTLNSTPFSLLGPPPPLLLTGKRHSTPRSDVSTGRLRLPVAPRPAASGQVTATSNSTDQLAPPPTQRQETWPQQLWQPEQGGTPLAFARTAAQPGGRR